MLMDIILYLLQIIQDLYRQNCWLINFICRYIPLKQWAFDDSHSPKYQKFKIDELPLVTDSRQDWSYKELIPYYEKRYGKKIRPVSRRSECDIPDDCTCPRCDAPKPFLYKNNGSKGQLLCKICSARFSPAESRFSSLKLRCPHCGHSLVPKKKRKLFILHKCVNPKCPYYLYNLKQVDTQDLKEDYGKNKYKLHYIYREFTMDFFSMDLNTLPKNASSLNFSKHNAHVMALCLTFHVNLGLSLRKTSQALKDLYNISVSHQPQQARAFFELQEFILFPSQTIYFHHESYSDFQTFLKSGLLPCAAHRPLPVHNLFPKWDLIADIVIYEPIHSFQATQPLFQFLFLGLCCFPGNCVFLYWVVLRVMLVDQIQQILHWRVILRLCFLQVLLQHFLQFFYNATILPN